MASPEDVGMSSERLLEIDAVIKRHVDTGEIQGAVTAVARRGKVVHFEAYGLMDTDRGRPMEKNAIFRMASSSKPVLGVAAMMMVEEGLFDPADEVAEYLPEFGDMQVAVPGLGSYGLGTAVAKLPNVGPDDTLASRVPLYARMPLDFQPGSRWGYSPRIGHDVVARIVEIVSGESYDEFLRRRIFEPLGMADTHFFLPPEKESRRVVIHGLDGKAKGWDKPSRYASASGGLSSTAEDFLRFEQMLAGGGELFGNRLLSPESVVRMSSNQVGGHYGQGGKESGSGFGYAVSVVLDPVAAKSTRGKGAFGWGGAFGTVSWTDPANEITAVLMVQQGSKGVSTGFESAIRAAIVD